MYTNVTQNSKPVRSTFGSCWQNSHVTVQLEPRRIFYTTAHFWLFWTRITEILEFCQIPVESWRSVTLSIHYIQSSMDFNFVLYWAFITLWLSFFLQILSGIHLSLRILGPLAAKVFFSHSTERKSVHLVPVVVPSICTRLTVPLAGKPLHRMALPPPCFSAGELFVR